MRQADHRPNIPATGHAVSRRSLLLALPCLGLAQSMVKAGEGAFPAATLRAYVDVLVPRDLTTPAASDLGVDVALKKHAETVTNYTRLLTEGGSWLDVQAFETAGKPFDLLSDSAADRIVRLAGAAAPRTLPRVFFTYTRDDVMRLYYGHAEAWPGLGAGRAPQPLGYPDAHLPPGRRG